MYFDLRLWALTRGSRLHIAAAVTYGLLTAAAGIARLVLLGVLLGGIGRGELGDHDDGPWAVPVTADGDPLDLHGLVAGCLLRVALHASQFLGHVPLGLDDLDETHGLSFLLRREVPDRALSLPRCQASPQGGASGQLAEHPGQAGS